MFPFKYKGHIYNECTYADSSTGNARCAINIKPNAEVPNDGLHWGTCRGGCPDWGGCQRVCPLPGTKNSI